MSDMILFRILNCVNWILKLTLESQRKIFNVNALGHDYIKND